MGRARIAGPFVALPGESAASLPRRNRSNRRRGGRAEASDSGLLCGQVGQERGRIAVAVSVGQVMGDRAGSEPCRRRSHRVAIPAGGQLFDLAGGGADVHVGWAFPGHAERVAEAYAVSAPSMRPARSKTSCGYSTHAGRNP